eukprot:4253813-Pyramimonas_sp.AAC.2
MWLAFGRSAASQQPPTKYEVLTNPKGAPVNAVSYEDALTLVSADSSTRQAFCLKSTKMVQVVSPSGMYVRTFVPRLC